ncbi:MAG: ribokinase [Rhodobacteraceae bacterium]|nr:ribokinase [Paracoccaceae bacterium]
MAIWNLGAINADLVYQVLRLPMAGETVGTSEYARYLGGKGANISVAAVRAAAQVRHIGAVGPDGTWAINRLREYGVDTRFIETVATPTGHAMIAVDADAENQIIIYSGANRQISEDLIRRALSEAQAGDILVMQNETNAQNYAAGIGRQIGLTVCYAAAPFDADALQAVLPHLDFLILNAVEAQQLQNATGLTARDLAVNDVIVTQGADGCIWYNNRTATDHRFAAFPVTPLDTTGAGDTFTGYVLAGFDRGTPMAQTIQYATRAAAIMVTRHGTADVIPDLNDVQNAQLD